MLYKFNKEKKDFVIVNMLYHNSLEGYDAYVCGSGPSLEHNRVFNRVPAMNIIGVPKSYPYSNADFLIGSSASRKEFELESFYMNNEIFVPYNEFQASYSNISTKICWYESSGATDINDLFDEFKGLHLDTYIWNHGSSLESSLHFALWMGHRTIYLLGCDFSLDHGDYCSSWAVLNEEEREIQSNSFKLRIEFLEKFVGACGGSNIKIYSCTQNSPINSFLEYLSIEDALEATAVKAHSLASSVDFLDSAVVNDNTAVVNDNTAGEEKNTSITIDDDMLFNEDLFNNLSF